MKLIASRTSSAASGSCTGCTASYNGAVIRDDAEIWCISHVSSITCLACSTVIADIAIRDASNALGAAFKKTGVASCAVSTYRATSVAVWIASEALIVAEIVWGKAGSAFVCI